jgi:alpha-N-arabinofuranosidase
MTAQEYGRKAVDAARQMRAVDNRLQLVACGSSGPGMATYLEWDRLVLEECYDQVDAISLHRYFGLGSDIVKDDARFLASNVEMERRSRTSSPCATTCADEANRPSVSGSRSTNGTCGTGSATATAGNSARRGCSRKSTTFATRWLSVARSTR